MIIPEGVTAIGAFAFRGCSSLTSVIIPEGVPAIGQGASDGCSSLTSVIVPEGVATIGAGAFEKCPNLFIFCPPSRRVPDFPAKRVVDTAIARPGFEAAFVKDVTINDGTTVRRGDRFTKV